MASFLFLNITFLHLRLVSLIKSEHGFFFQVSNLSYRMTETFDNLAHNNFFGSDAARVVWELTSMPCTPKVGLESDQDLLFDN